MIFQFKSRPVAVRVITLFDGTFVMLFDGSSGVI